MLITHSVDVLTRRGILDNLKGLGKDVAMAINSSSLIFWERDASTPKNLVAIEAKCAQFHSRILATLSWVFSYPEFR
ncbi:MAG: hypothetical protein Ct9H90mP27_6160 [Gammaproteobacteria bacterium]|nr:MAG: hypothetical protein Ct9H90mP27_6160 [Gammaproteobacteria bacterium]